MHLKTCIALCMAVAFMIPPAPGAFFWGARSADAAGPRATEEWWGPVWSRRAPVTINNSPNPLTLNNYQVPINVSYMNKMKTDFSDIRFVQNVGGTLKELPFWLESKEDGKKAKAWVNVNQLPAQATSVIYMYYGNPSAKSSSSGNTTFDFFDDFNGSELDSAKWNPIHLQNSSISGKVSGGMLDFTAVAQSQHTGACVISKISLPTANYIAETKVKFTDYYQSAYGAYAGFTDSIAYDYSAYGTPAKLVAAKLWDYTKQGWYLYVVGDNIPGTLGNGTYGTTQITIRNIWFKIVTIYTPGTYVKGIWTQLEAPFTEMSLEQKGTGGIDPTYVACGVGEYNTNEDTYFDYVLIRKYSAVEPSVSIGTEEQCPISLKSMTYGPARMNDGETVFFNATFTNSFPQTFKLRLAAREADNFNDTTDYFYEEEVSLAPSADTTFPFSWTAVGGPHTIWLAVYDYPFASAKIKVNRDPVLAPLKDQSLLQDREFIFQINASDPDGDSLDWSIDNPLFNISLVSNRSAEISFLPTNDDVGVHRANITVRDPMNRSATQRINFTVNNVNDPPVLAKIPSLAATQYNELRYQAKAEDPDLKWGDVLTFSENTDLFEIDAKTGEFAFTPVEEQVGKHNVKITVADKEGASQTASFTITVANVNDPPTLEFLPPQSALQGRLFQLKIVAADPDLKSDPTEKLRFSDDSPLFNINNDTGLISFTPTNDQIGVWLANITVTDKGGLSNTTSLTITVMNANDPPAIEAILTQTATEDQPFQCQVNASDPDLKWGLDNLTFTDDTDLFNIDPKTGAIAFTPTGAQVGPKRVTITVKDEKGATASTSFDMTVVHINHPPYDATIKYPLDGAKLKEGDEMWLDGTAKDSDKGDTLEYSWLDNGEPAGIGKNISVKLKPGKHTITLEVSDGTETVSKEISIDVEKKETVTVAGGGNDWILLAAAAVAVLAIVAVVAVLAARRRKRQEEPEPSEEGRIDSVPEGEGIALPPVPPAEAGPQASGEEAERIIDSAVDKLANYQEAHPEEAVDVAPVMEKLDIARGFLKSGEYDDALDFARDAEAAVDKMTAPAAPKKVAVKKKKAVGVKDKDTAATKDKTASAAKKCPGCGEELQPEWATCPVCGHRP
jgi:hypothetical protein